MRAITLHSYGPAGNLRPEEAPDPIPGPGQVRVAVHAAGVHFMETNLRRGLPVGPHPAPPLPAVLGGEVAGVVDALGDGVDGAWLGRRVLTGSGGYRSLAVSPVEELVEIPDGLGYGAAVAMHTTGATTMGLLEAAPIKPDDVVLVLAAAGGIGTLLVQHARHVGARVIGAASGPEKAARVKSLGADVAVDYARPGWDREPVTVVFDGVGGELGRAASALLGGSGRHVMYGTASGAPTEPGGGVTVIDGIGWILGRGGTADLRDAALRAAAEGVLVPAVQEFPLEEAALAHEALESRATMGKVVLTA